MALTLALESSSRPSSDGRRAAAAAGGEGQGGGGSDGGHHGGPSSSGSRRRERMFEKVVTPSDVGKLNRLVVPKHLAQKHLPLLPGAAAGTVLCFHDARSGGGAAWRFRYSYWSSSQSYVMTKGWSRYVRDKRLAAGDTVSFCRDGARLFIDCRRQRRAAGGGPVPPQQQQQAFFFPKAAVQVQVQAPPAVVVDAVAMEEEEARRRRRLRLFGVDLELEVELRAEPLLLDLQL